LTTMLSRLPQACTLALALLLLPLGAAAQAIGSGGTTTTAAAVRTLTGRVINGKTGGAVPRALVTINTRSVLTDALGRFEFPGFTDSQAVARAQKPGFASSLDANQQQAMVRITDMDAPIELKLYPDGIITGTVTGRDGLPLTRISVSLLRAQYNIVGMQSFNAGFSQTDSHGQFRFRQPPGRYRISLRYTPRAPDSGFAVLPVQFPETSSSHDSGFFELSSGQELNIDLRPRSGPSYTVMLHTDLDEGRGNLRIEATGAGGESFDVGAQRSGQQGEYRVNLPNGTYLLHALMQQQDAALEGTTRVTVAGRNPDPVDLHLSPVASIPVDFSMDLDPATTTSTVVNSPPSPTVQNLNLYFHSLAAIEGQNSDIRPTAGPDKTFNFRLPAGRYRLTGGFGGGFWHVESANYGQSNLLTDELVMAAGATGSTLRVVVSNSSGQISGTIEPVPAAGSTVSPGWVYLVPQFPSLTPFTQLRISTTGAWSASLAPGTYQAIAVSDPIQADLRDPAVAARYTRLGKPVVVTDAVKATLTLDLITELKEKP
jgi:hypothetical protein